MRAVIYLRCSTDESKQDVDTQLDKCVRFGVGNGWDYEKFI